MADIPYISQAQEVKITGQDATGNNVNYVGADANGNMFVDDNSNGPVTPGTVANVSSLIGGQFNTSLPTLTTGQQAALQVDSSGRLITAPQTVTVGVTDKSTFTYGTSPFSNSGGVFQDTAPTLTAGQQGIVRMTANRAIQMNLRDSSGNELLGQKTMANSIPVVISSDQSVISVGGNVADGAADSGNTVKVGGVYDSTLPTLANGQRSHLELDIGGKLRIVQMTPNPAGTITQAAITVGITAVRLTVSGSAPNVNRSVLMAIADTASTATFYIGSSSVTNSGATRGMQIVAGQPFIANNDAGDYYIIASAASQTVYVTEQA